MKTLVYAALAFTTLTTTVAASEQALAFGGWEKSESTYEVPVPEELKDVAVFAVKNVQTRTRNGVEEIKYNLPLELTGIANRIRLKSKPDGSYVGPNAEGTCEEGVCHLKYKDLNFDRLAVRDLFAEQGIVGVELDRRMQVFEHFSGDPAGIIRRKPARKY